MGYGFVANSMSVYIEREISACIIDDFKLLEKDKMSLSIWRDEDTKSRK
jgi:hypothetical protein